MNSETEQRRQVPFVFHVLSFGALICGMLAVNSVVNSGGFVVSAASLAIVGHLASILMRNRQKTTRLVEIGVFGLCLVIYMRVMLTPYELMPIHPVISDSPQIKFAQLLIWMECLRAFTIVSAEAALFTGVTSVAAIGLIATDNLDSEIMVYFVIYMFFEVAMLTRYASMAGRRARVAEQNLLGQLRLPLIVTVAAMAAGVILTGPAKVISTAALGKSIPRLPGEGIVKLPGITYSSGSMPVMQGPAFLSEREVFSVRSKRPCYWRGSVYGTYSGTVWENVPGAETGVSSRQVFGSETLEQTLTIRPGFLTTTLYGAADPVSITPEKRLHTRLYPDRWNCWKTNKTQPAGFRYRVVSRLPNDSPAKLAKSGTQYPEDIRRVYLQTRSLTKNNPVRELALKVTRDCDNPYEKAVALESYLSREYRYDLNPPRPPMGRDVVEFFLFDSRTGYCTAFASAMAVMLREIGIPSRIARGFAPGYFNTRRGVYSVMEKDAHAWVEVYFPQCGWVTFDPTEGSEEGQQTFWSLLQSETRKAIYRTFGKRPWLSTGLLILFSIVCLARPDLAATRVALRRRRTSDRGLHMAQRRYEAMCRVAAGTAGRRTTDTTPTEFSRLCSQSLSQDAGNLVEDITLRFEQVRYGGREPDERFLGEMDSNLRRLKAAVRRRRV